MDFWSDLSGVVKGVIVAGVLAAIALAYLGSDSEPSAEEIRQNDARRAVHAPR